MAARYRVQPAAIDRYARRERETGSLTPRPIPGGDDDAALAEQVRAHADARLAEYRALRRERTDVGVVTARDAAGYYRYRGYHLGPRPL